MGSGQKAAKLCILFSYKIWTLEIVSFFYGFFPGKEMVGQAIRVGKDVPVPFLFVVRFGQTYLHGFIVHNAQKDKLLPCQEAWPSERAGRSFLCE